MADQVSYFFARGYFDADEVKSLVGEFRHYAYILHDRDVWTQYDCGETHSPGDKKVAHYHLVLNVYQKISSPALRRKLLKKFPKSGLWLRDLQHGESAVSYLTHTTDKAISEGKVKYDVNEIVSDCPFEYFASDIVKETIKQDHIDPFSEFFQISLEQGFASRSLFREYCVRFGRDFILNGARALQALGSCLGCSQEWVFLTPEERDLAQKELDSAKNK